VSLSIVGATARFSPGVVQSFGFTSFVDLEAISG
jgi:hypothetical protein